MKQRGFLAGRFTSAAELEELDEDFRRRNPRCVGENLEANRSLATKLPADRAGDR